MYDVVIIGAGVSGAAIARELSRYQVNACVVERAEDVCCGTSKANSAIVHAGFDAKTGSLMAKLNVQGSQLMEDLSRELDFPYRRNGSLVLCLNPDELPGLQALYERGVANGVEGLEILDAATVSAMEPNVTEQVVAALWAPTGAIVCPFGLNFALAENAAANGVEFRFDCPVTAVKPKGDHWEVICGNTVLEAACVVNAAGVYSDVLHNMVSARKLHITPRRGDYFLLDKTAGNHVNATIFQLPDEKYGKGVLVTPTVHGNLLVGPTAVDIQNRDGTNTTRAGLDSVTQKSNTTVKNLPLRQTITSFAGLRAHEDGADFVIGEVEDAPGFFDCAGIESPGIASCPAIGKMVAELLRQKLALEEKVDFIPTRKGILNPWQLSAEELNALIAEKPDYGQIVCRCESITMGEIVDAVTRPLGAKSLDGVKRRTRAGMGRCQGGFCSPRVMDIIARHTDIPYHQVTKSGGSSRLITGCTKEVEAE